MFDIALIKVVSYSIITKNRKLVGREYVRENYRTYK